MKKILMLFAIVSTMLVSCGEESTESTDTTTPPTTEEGNYETPEVPISSICVTSFGAAMTPCFGGTLDDYMEGFVSLDSITPVDVEFTIEVGYVPGSPLGNCDNPKEFINLYVTVPAGSSYGSLDCSSSPFIDSGGAKICTINLIDGPYQTCSD